MKILAVFMGILGIQSVEAGVRVLQVGSMTKLQHSGYCAQNYNSGPHVSISTDMWQLPDGSQIQRQQQVQCQQVPPAYFEYTYEIHCTNMDQIQAYTGSSSQNILLTPNHWVSIEQDVVVCVNAEQIIR